MAGRLAVVCAVVFVALWGLSCGRPAGTDDSSGGAGVGDAGTAASLVVLPVATQVPNIRLAANPMRIFIRQWVKLEARLGDVVDHRVKWSVQEGDAGGTVAADGTYTAPAQVGLYHVAATGLDDPRVGGTIEIEAVVTQDLYDYGGAILAGPRLQLIWWGKAEEFRQGVAKLHAFLAGVNGSAWLSVLDQYMRGDAAHVALAGEIFDTSPHPVGAIPDPAGEICGVLADRHLAPDPGTIYALMVATSTGKFDFHTTAVCQGVRVPILVLELPESGARSESACGGEMSPAERMLWAFSHELAETMTDPYPGTGWADIFNQEVADDCTRVICAALPTGSFSVTALLSNAAHGCAP